MGLKRTRTSKRRTLGMAMVEMVFVLPVLILLVFAIAEFGLMFSRWLTLSNAVREGARAGVAFRGTKDECKAASPSVAKQVQTRVANYAQAGGIPLNPSDVNVQNTCEGPDNDLIVDASYLFKLNIPFASLNNVNLSYKSTMRNE